MNNLKSTIFNMLLELDKTELYGIMGTATSHEFYPIRYISSLIVSRMDTLEDLLNTADDMQLVQYIELYSDIFATYTQGGEDAGILSLIKKS